MAACMAGVDGGYGDKAGRPDLGADGVTRSVCSRDARIELSYPPQSRRGFQPPQEQHRDFDHSCIVPQGGPNAPDPMAFLVRPSAAESAA